MGICFALVIAVILGVFLGIGLSSETYSGYILLLIAAIVIFVSGTCLLTRTQTIDDAHWLKYNLEKLEPCNE
jgi:uncharacterized membrane protein YfcA